MNATTQNQRYALQELEKEALMGAEGEETFTREVRCIDLSNFAERKHDIAEQLWERRWRSASSRSATMVFRWRRSARRSARPRRFFNLPDEVKRQYPLAGNAGWESKAQVRPSTRTPDQKESYQITRPLMDGRWPSDRELPGFRQTMLGFESQCWQLG